MIANVTSFIWDREKRVTKNERPENKKLRESSWSTMTNVPSHFQEDRGKEEDYLHD